MQGVKTSPCILYHFVVLAPDNPQEQSQVDTNIQEVDTNTSHGKIIYNIHTISDSYLNSCILNDYIAMKQLTANKDMVDSAE